ncbi:MAG: DNA polymerase III subunit beta [Bacillota bacterium]|nr:DNA polymerase III subunit beta [Bacillota bacterium]
MKFHCSQEELYLGVSVVQRAVSAKNTIPILGGVYLEATSNNKLILRSTDLEIGIEHIINVTTSEPGKVVLPAKYFVDIVRRLPNTNINLELINNALLITYEKSKLNINTFPAEEFPNLPIIDELNNFTLAANVFKKAIRQVSIAASPIDNNRPIFTGILMDFSKDNELTVVATDTHRLTYRTEKVKSSEVNADKLDIIVPSKVLLEISRLIDSDSIINLIIGKNNQVVFKFGSTSIFSRLIQGQFPNYKQVIPVSFKSEIKISTKSFLDSLERAALLNREEEAKKKSNNVKLLFQEDVLSIDSYAAEVGNIHEELNVTIEGEEFEISFNAKYLLDVLKVLEEEYINFKLTGPLSPAIIEPISDDNFLYLVLPVRSN